MVIGSEMPSAPAACECTQWHLCSFLYCHITKSHPFFAEYNKPNHTVCVSHTLEYEVF